MLIEKLTVIGLAIAGLGTIQEADGVKEHTFWLRNDGTEAVALQQGYTSCGCTTIAFDKNAAIAPGDSTPVTLRFNPMGKGGEFYESGTIVYGQARQYVQMALEGTCVSSEESLQRQFPIVEGRLRVSNNRFDLGRMTVGTSKTVHVTVLHCEDNNRKELFAVSFTADKELGKGLHHVLKTITTTDGERTVEIDITLDVLIQ